MTGSPSIPACETGGDLNAVGVLEEVEIDPVTGDVLVGGECGRVWRLDAASGTWSELKSHTSAHVRGMSFEPTAGEAFLAGFRHTEVQQSIVHYDKQ